MAVYLLLALVCLLSSLALIRTEFRAERAALQEANRQLQVKKELALPPGQRITLMYPDRNRTDY
jgi:hypothetical protein